MGWQIRFGNGEEVTPLTLGETIREAHPKSECVLLVRHAITIDSYIWVHQLLTFL